MMANHMGRDGPAERDRDSDGPTGPDVPPDRDEASHRSGSPLGTDPQEASPLPGDPREAREPQKPRTAHLAPGRGDATPPARASDHEERDDDTDRAPVDHLRDAWDRMRGKK